MNKSFVRTFAILVCLLQIPHALAANTIQIAFINSLSGPFALQAEETLKSLQAAVDLVNSRGGVLNGKKIELVPLDNKGNPQETLVVLQQAIDKDIRYVISGVSNIAHATSDFLAKYNARNPDRAVLFLDYGALDPALTESKCSFWHFRFEPHADAQVSVLTNHIAAQRAVRKVYLINQDYTYGQAVSRVSREMLAAKRPDIQIVGDDLIPLGKVKDFSPYVAKIRASGADSVVTGNWGNDLSLLIKASNEAGLKANYYTLLAALFGSPAAIGAAGSDRVRTIFSWDINVADAVWEKRLLDYKAKYRAVSNLAYLPTLRVVEMLVGAIGKTASLDTAKVAYALEGMQYVGPVVSRG